MDTSPSHAPTEGETQPPSRAHAALLTLALTAWGIYAIVLLTDGPRTWIATLHLAISAASTAACLLAARRQQSRWELALAAAVATYGAAGGYYVLVSDAAARFPSLFDLGLPLFYVFATVAVIGLVRARVATVSRVLWLDAATVGLALMALGAFVVDPAGIAGLAELGQLAYFLADLAILGVLTAAWTLSGARVDRGLLLVWAGVAAMAAGDGYFVERIARGATSPTAVESLFWAAAPVLLAAASGHTVNGREPRSFSWANTGVPAASAVVSLPIALVTTGITSYCAVAALGLIVARMTLGLRENQELLRSMTRAAIRDPLTGLANRKLLLERLDHGLERLRRTASAPNDPVVPSGKQGCLAVLFLDLDDFKAVNDTRGHEAGDRLLVAVAEVLRRVLRRQDTVARGDAPDTSRGATTIGRLGGDEFLVVLEGLRDPADAALVADRVLRRLGEGTVFDGAPVELSASIGITVTDGRDGRTSAELLRDADIAMYAAKSAGRGRYEFFEAPMRDRVAERVRLIHQLRGALDRRELVLLYQPQVQISDQSISGVEALVRWNHPSDGLLTPDRFIPLAETHGLIVDLDDWVLREACRQMVAWDRSGLPPLRVAVNVSGHRLVAGDLAATVARVAEETGADLTRFTIEITETVAVEHDELALRAINGVRALGVKVSIDDFGMGHSALSRLQSFPVDRLKIDRSFVATLTPASAEGSLAAAMLAMARSLDLVVTAEGVETDEQLVALRQLGCERAQGYLFSKPVPEAEIARLAAMAHPFGPVTAEPTQMVRDDERLVHSLLAELERVTGFESTYLTRIAAGRQSITHARNTGALEIEHGGEFDWSDTVCRRSLDQDVRATDDVPRVFADSEGARQLGLQSYAGVPLYRDGGELAGTLCAASRNRVKLAPEALQLMESFARVIEARIFRESDAPA